MIRELTAASAALLVLGAVPFAPQAAATGGDQFVRVQDGKIRCQLSADYQGGGRAVAICGMTDGGPYGSSPMSTGKFPVKLNLAFVRSTGEAFYEAGTLPGAPAGDAVVGTGQTYSANGWTVTNEPTRALIINDVTHHGIVVNVDDWHQV